MDHDTLSKGFLDGYVRTQHNIHRVLQIFIFTLLIGIISACQNLIAPISISDPIELASTQTPIQTRLSWTQESSPTVLAEEIILVSPSATSFAIDASQIPAPKTEVLLYQTMAVEIATRIGARPLPTPMLACSVKVTGEGISYSDAPFSNSPAGTLSSGAAYDILVWFSPIFYLGENGNPKGWVRLPQFGLELSGSNCAPSGPSDLEYLYGFPNVCLFIALDGNAPPVLYKEPSFDSEPGFWATIGYYTGQKQGFYAITLSEAGPTGYVSQSSGQLIGDCP